MAQGQSTYPVQFSVDYPEQGLNRLTTLLRPLLIIPILVVIALVSGPTWDGEGDFWPLVAGGMLALPPLLLIVFRSGGSTGTWRW